MGYTSKFTGEQIDALLEKAGQGGGIASEMEYYRYNNSEHVATHGEQVMIFSVLLKYPQEFVTPSMAMMFGKEMGEVIAFAVIPSLEIDFQGDRKTIEEWFALYGGSLASLPRITEEEFYNIG